MAQNKAFVVAVYCFAPPIAHTSDKNRYRIFLMPVPTENIYTYGNILEQGFGS